MQSFWVNDMTEPRDFNHLWRDRNNTSQQRVPRVLIRVFVGPGELESSVRFYEDLQGVAADGGFPFPEAGLRLAMVGAFLLIEGTPEALAPFTSTTEAGDPGQASELRCTGLRPAVMGGAR